MQETSSSFFLMHSGSLEANADMTGGPHTGSTPDNNKELHFHYSREERLKKLRTGYVPERRRFFSRKTRRGLFIILVDILLVALVFYLLNRPANVYIEKEIDGVRYGLNVTGIKGKKILIGLTVKNQTADPIRFEKPIPVLVHIKKNDSVVLKLEKKIAENTLLSGESSSVIFLVEQNRLPKSALVQLFYNGEITPLFERNVRF